jgi:hypothetical protein
MRLGMKSSARWTAYAGSLLLLVLAAGCQSKAPVTPKTQVRINGASTENLSTNSTETFMPDRVFKTDPCAARLQDISGQLLLYYAVNRKLPDKLDDLRSLADVDAETNYTCPETGQPYVYAPQTLRASGLARLLVVYDAAPGKQGRRWCILIGEPKPGKPLATWVEPIPEPVFRSYAAVER